MEELFQFLFLFVALWFADAAILSLLKPAKKDKSLTDKIGEHVDLNPIPSMDIEETDITSSQFRKMKNND